MKSKKMVQETIQTRRAATLAHKGQTKPSTDKPRDPSTEALIADLRGRFAGKPSLVAALQRERRKDDRAKNRKLMASERELNAWMLKSR